MRNVPTNVGLLELVLPLPEGAADALVLRGLEASLVRVSVSLGGTAPGQWLIHGPEGWKRETRVRVRSALGAIGVECVEWGATIDITPEVTNVSGAVDLALAVAILVALGHVPGDRLANTAFYGELSLGGEVRTIRGVMPAIRRAAALGVKEVIVPHACEREAAAAARDAGVVVHVVKSLRQVIEWLAGAVELNAPAEAPAHLAAAGAMPVDMVDVRGYRLARRALEISAAGGHNLVLLGAPGSGKTMLARRLPTILPPMSNDESVAATELYSLIGMLRADHGLLHERPFRAPHHTTSPTGLVGGGDPVRPGELSTAHNGVLLLDEILEFKRSAVEVLRQPMSDGQVTICRSAWRVRFPADSIVVAASSRCPCGFYLTGRVCSCSNERRASYSNRLAAMELPRMDVWVCMDESNQKDDAPAESSATVQARVVAARNRQNARYADKMASASTNGKLTPQDLERVVRFDGAGHAVWTNAVDHFAMDSQNRAAVLRVARTIADLADSDVVRAEHVEEALRFSRVLFAAIACDKPKAA